MTTTTTIPDALASCAIRDLYTLAERHGAPPAVWEWLWSTHNAPDRDARLLQLSAMAADVRAERGE